MKSKLTSIHVDTDDIKGDRARIETRGGAFVLPPTKAPGSAIARLNDNRGNLVQITQLARR